MEANKDFVMLVIFADDMVHSFYEVVLMAKNLLNVNEKWVGKWLLKAKFNNWVSQAARTNHLFDTRYKLKQNGDLKYREESIRRGGDYSWFKYFDRTKESLDKFMPLKFRPARDSRDVPVQFSSPYEYRPTPKRKVYSYSR